MLCAEFELSVFTVTFYLLCKKNNIKNVLYHQTNGLYIAFKMFSAMWMDKIIEGLFYLHFELRNT